MQAAPRRPIVAKSLVGKTKQRQPSRSKSVSHGRRFSARFVSPALTIHLLPFTPASCITFIIALYGHHLHHHPCPLIYLAVLPLFPITTTNNYYITPNLRQNPPKPTARFGSQQTQERAKDLLRLLTKVFLTSPSPFHLPPCMDCGTTGTAAGIDPKILDNWQSDTFPIYSAYDQPLEWDASQDSSPGDADVVDLSNLRGPLSRDQSTVPVVGHAGDYRGSESRCDSSHLP